MKCAMKMNAETIKPNNTTEISNTNYSMMVVHGYRNKSYNGLAMMNSFMANDFLSLHMTMMTSFNKCAHFCGVCGWKNYEPEIFETLVEKLVDKNGITKSVSNILTSLKCVNMMPVSKKFIVYLFLRIVKMKHCESKLVPIRQFDKYCLLRQFVKKKNSKYINIERYENHFTFIRYMEEQEQLKKQTLISQLLILLMILLLSGSSAELKKFLSLKYEYDDAILYLLWCSGDVEFNPGPTFQKLEKLPNSQKERNWLCGICSVLAKLALGISADDLSCKLIIWSTKPTDFPGDFSTPRKKSAKDLNSFFYDLLHYCKNIKKLSIPDPYQKEIDLYEADKTLLLKSFISRQETSQITKSVTNLNLYNGAQELQQCMTNMKIGINFGPNAPSSSVDMVERSEIRRDLAVTLCKISKGLKPTLKSDGIWKEPPQCWNPVHPYYSPHNAGKRTDNNPDRTLVNNLLEYIRANHLTIPDEYKAMIKAWEEDNIDDLRKMYTIHVYTAAIEHSLKYLKLEGLLKDNEDKLKQIGLTLDPEWFNSDSTGQSTSEKRKVSTKSVTKTTSRPGRGCSSCHQGSKSSSDSQEVSVCQQTVHFNTSTTLSKCPDNQSDGTIWHTVDSNALANYTGSSTTIQPINQSVLQPDNTVSPTSQPRYNTVLPPDSTVLQPDRGCSSCHQGSNSSSDSQEVSVCQQTVHFNTSTTLSKCPDNQSDGTIWHTVDSNALANYTGSSTTIQSINQSVLQPDNTVSPTRQPRYNTVLPPDSTVLQPDNTISPTRKSRKRKVPDEQEKKQNSVKKRKIQTKNHIKRSAFPFDQSSFAYTVSTSADSTVLPATNTVVLTSIESSRSAFQFDQSSSTCTVSTSADNTVLPATNTVVLPSTVSIDLPTTNTVALTSIESSYLQTYIDQPQQPLPELNPQEVFDILEGLTQNDQSASSQTKQSSTSEQQCWRYIDYPIDRSTMN